MNFNTIDPYLLVFAKKHKLHLSLCYKDSDVRSFEIVSPLGERYQMWVEDVDSSKVIIKGWDFKNLSCTHSGSIFEIEHVLNQTYDEIQSWINKKQ